MAAINENSSGTTVAERIANVNPKTFSVGDMVKLLFDITGEKKWVDREFYKEFAKVRRRKVIGNPRTGDSGWLGNWDPDFEDAMLPDYVEEATEKFTEWIRGQNTWYSGDWASHNVLCRWQVYQEVNLQIKSRLRDPRRRAMQTEAPGRSAQQDSNTDLDGDVGGASQISSVEALAQTAKEALNAVDSPPPRRIYDPVRGWNT